jgi:hypothetical protein
MSEKPLTPSFAPRRRFLRNAAVAAGTTDALAAPLVSRARRR